MKKQDKLNNIIDKSLKLLNIKVNKKHRELLMQIIRFIIVGGIATLIDWIVYYISYRFIGINPLIANIISFIISVIYNFNASCTYVFNVSKKKDYKLFAEFIGFSLIGLGINEIVIFIFHIKLHFDAMLVKVAASILVIIFNFISRKIFLERKK